MKNTFLTFILLFSLGVVYAQPKEKEAVSFFDQKTGKSSSTFFDTKLPLAAPPPPTPVPIDGGTSLLLLAGVGYGLKRMRKKNN